MWFALRTLTPTLSRTREWEWEKLPWRASAREGAGAPPALSIPHPHLRHLRKPQSGGAPIFGAVRQAHRTGKGAPSLMAQPIRELLARPLDEVRAELRIAEPTQYRECHRIWQAEGIDPYNLLASESAERELLAA